MPATTVMSLGAVIWQVEARAPREVMTTWSAVVNR